jgi:hypothetical protein
MGGAKRNPSLSLPRQQEEPAMTTRNTRRRARQTGATALPLMHIRSGHDADRRELVFWDHRVSFGLAESAGDRHAGLQPRHAARDAGQAVHRPIDSAQAIAWAEEELTGFVR